MFWESLPHTLRCGPCFGGVPIPGSAQGTDYHPVGTEGRTAGDGVGHHMEGRRAVRGRLLMPQKYIT